MDSYDDEVQVLIQDWRAETLIIATSSIEYQREDYEEFTKLVHAYLGQNEGDFNFCRPGAIHKARWMAKVIYFH